MIAAYDIRFDEATEYRTALARLMDHLEPRQKAALMLDLGHITAHCGEVYFTDRPATPCDPELAFAPVFSDHGELVARQVKRAEQALSAYGASDADAVLLRDHPISQHLLATAFDVLFW